jgi:hypothetical protein
VENRNLAWFTFDKPYTAEFEGTGVVVRGEVRPLTSEYAGKEYEAIIEIRIDSSVAEVVHMPLKYAVRRTEIYWNYNLPDGRHAITVTHTNPDKSVAIRYFGLVVYSDTLPGAEIK